MSAQNYEKLVRARSDLKSALQDLKSACDLNGMDIDSEINDCLANTDLNFEIVEK